MLPYHQIIHICFLWFSPKSLEGWWQGLSVQWFSPFRNNPFEKLLKFYLDFFPCANVCTHAHWHQQNWVQKGKTRYMASIQCTPTRMEGTCSCFGFKKIQLPTCIAQALFIFFTSDLGVPNRVKGRKTHWTDTIEKREINGGVPSLAFQRTMNHCYYYISR